MERLVANLSGGVRRDSLYGRPHLVASATLIVPGVLNGSNGPLLYPPEELKANPYDWNNMPILVYHPKKGKGRDIETLNSQGVGVVLNTTYSDRLRAELWFDEARTREVDPRVYSRLEKGEQIELSTGLGTTNQRAPENAVFEGPEGKQIPYRAIARNYRPDHLAVLPDQVGACSLRDGCGVFNEENKAVAYETDDEYERDDAGKFGKDDEVDPKTGKPKSKKKKKPGIKGAAVGSAEAEARKAEFTATKGAKNQLLDPYDADDEEDEEGSENYSPSQPRDANGRWGGGGGGAGGAMGPDKGGDFGGGGESGKTKGPKSSIDEELGEGVSVGTTVGGMVSIQSTSGKGLKADQVEAVVKRAKVGDSVFAVFTDQKGKGDQAQGKTMTGTVKGFGTVKGTKRKAAILDVTAGDMGIGEKVLSPMASIHAISFGKTKNQLGQSGQTFNNGRSDMTDNERKEIIDGLIENSCCWTENDREELEGLSDIALQKTLQAAEKAVENEELLAAAEKGFNDGRDDLAYNREKRVWEKKEKPVTTNATAPVKPELSDEDKAILNYGREMMAKEKADLIERLTQNAGEAKAAQAKVYEGLAIEQLRSIAPPAKAPAQNFYGPEVTNAKKVNREDMFVPTDIDFVANSAFAK